jgi:hypothetical protein
MSSTLQRRSPSASPPPPASEASTDSFDTSSSADQNHRVSREKLYDFRTSQEEAAAVLDRELLVFLEKCKTGDNQHIVLVPEPPTATTCNVRVKDVSSDRALEDACKQRYGSACTISKEVDTFDSTHFDRIVSVSIDWRNRQRHQTCHHRAATLVCAVLAAGSLWIQNWAAAPWTLLW